MKRSGSSLGSQTALPRAKQASCAGELLGARNSLEPASVRATPQLARMQQSHSTEPGGRRACSRVRS